MRVALEAAFVLMLALCAMGILSCLVACARVLWDIVRHIRALISEHRTGNRSNLSETEGLCPKKG
jgi:hypothetical protein